MCFVWLRNRVKGKRVPRQPADFSQNELSCPARSDCNMLLAIASYHLHVLLEDADDPHAELHQKDQSSFRLTRPHLTSPHSQCVCGGGGGGCVNGHLRCSWGLIWTEAEKKASEMLLSGKWWSFTSAYVLIFTMQGLMLHFWKECGTGAVPSSLAKPSDIVGVCSCC